MTQGKNTYFLIMTQPLWTRIFIKNSGQNELNFIIAL